MRVRITQRVPHEDAILFPGTEIEVDNAIAEKWIADDVAILFEEQQAEPVEEVIKPRVRRLREVKDGDG